MSSSSPSTSYRPAVAHISPFLYVSAPAASLRKEPLDSNGGVFDDLQESQLLANELFRPIHEERDWYYGQAVEQPYYTEEGWIGYPGWVRKSELATVTMAERPNGVIISRDTHVFPGPEGTQTPVLTLPLGSRIYAEPQSGSPMPYLRVRLYSGATGWVHRDSLRFIDSPETASLSEALIREAVRNAFLLIGIPYRWGGMVASPAVALSPTSVAAPGVDCSALVCLSYRLSGVDIPRNARDQWIWAQPIQGRNPRAGDLVFIAREDGPEAIMHVTICTGRDSLIEASETGRTVSQTTFRDKFGLSYGDLKQAGFMLTGKRVYLGRITKGLSGTFFTTHSAAEVAQPFKNQ